MPAITVNLWAYFLASFTLYLLTNFWMVQVARRFKTASATGTAISFSIFDLEFALSEEHVVKIIDRADDAAKKALRLYLLLDFVFMTATYLGIAVLCLVTAQKMEYVGRYVFLALAVAQILPWVFDVVENVYLLDKIKRPVANTEGFFKTFQFLVKAKFVIALTGAVCSLFALLYFWLVGNFHLQTLKYIGAVIVEVLVFIIINAIIENNRKKQLA